MHWYLIRKSPEFVKFGANLTQIVLNFDIPDENDGVEARDSQWDADVLLKHTERDHFTCNQRAVTRC